MPPIVFIVDRRDAGQTLAAVLKKRFGLSWSRAKRLVDGQHVRIGQQIETDAARRLKLGKRITLDASAVEIKTAGGSRQKNEDRRTKTEERRQKNEDRRTKTASRESKTLAPPVAGIEIVYSDDAIVVVNKPTGLTTMRHREEAAEFGRGKRFLPLTLADLLPGLLGTPDRPVIAVHRIDRDTSGLVVFARTKVAAENLMRQFRKHTVDRRYVALTRGIPQSGRIESSFVRDRGDGRRGSSSRANSADGKRAISHVKVVEELGAFAVVECRLETGRTHQVRIHLGESGSPLCGERVYDRPVNRKPPPDESGAQRPMLHAARLGITHPENGELMSWDVKPPDDFARLWARLRSQ